MTAGDGPAARLLATWRAGDLDGLAALLSPDIAETLDSGGPLGPAPTRSGPAAIAARLIAAHRGAELELGDVNGDPGIVVRRAGTVVAVVCLAHSSGLVTDLWTVLAPEKLAGWNRH